MRDDYMRQPKMPASHLTPRQEKTKESQKVTLSSLGREGDF